MDNNQTTAYEKAAKELGDKLVALYKLRIFPRDGKTFAEMLFTAGTEAGSLIWSMSQLSDKELKVRTANEALLKISRAEYILGIMCTAGYYTASEVYDLSGYIVKVKESLKALLKNAQDAAKARQARPYYGTYNARTSDRITYVDNNEGLDDPV